MYTAVLMAALTTTTAAPNWHRGWQSCACYNGYPYAYNPGCYCGGYGFAGGGCGYHGGCYGGYGGGYIPYGGGYGYGYAIPYGVGCYGCYGGYSCYGVPLPVTTQQPFAPGGTTGPAPNPYPPINPAPKPSKGTTEEEVPAPKEKKKTSLDSTTPMRARIRIDVPEGGKLFVDDRLIATPAGTRVFQTPPLAPGDRYYYDIRIESASQTHRQRVIIEAGQEVAVSMSAPRPATAQR